MTHLTPVDVARRYFVTDLSEATIPATRLRNILDSIQQGRQVTAIALNFLQKQGLISLHRLAQSAVTYEAFCGLAQVEKDKREMAAEAALAAKEAERKANEAAWAVQYAVERQRAEEARIARESDPKYINKVRNQRLRARYALDVFIEKSCFGRLMDILHRIDRGNRFGDEDILWLTTEGKDYYSVELRAMFHAHEAEFFVDEYKRTNDPWMAVNASGHYRRCDKAESAHDLLASIPIERQTSPILRSALSTTHGGVMRDLLQWTEALKLGNQAHTQTPNDFRPCTLLGAVNMELGNYDLGKEWYAKAMARGASERSIDQDLRGIFLRADRVKREEIKAFLLREDPVRYRWVKSASIQP